MKQQSLKKLLVLLSVLLVLCAVLAGCVAKPTPDEPSDPSEPTTYTVTITDKPSGEVDLSVGTITLKATTTKPDGVITWSTSSSEKATVSAGVVTLKSAGVVTIIASMEGTDLTDSVTLEIVDDSPKAATGVRLSGVPTAPLTYTQREWQLGYTLLPQGSAAEEVTFTSSDPSVLTVSSSGKVTVTSPGKATVRVALKSNADLFDEAEISAEWNMLEGDDGAFDGVSGNLSVYACQTEEISDRQNYSWATVSRFLFTSDAAKLPAGASGRALEVVSDAATKTDEWSMVFFKFALPVRAGYTYDVTFDAKWLGNEDASGFYYFIECGKLEEVRDYNEISRENLFKSGAKITFVADSDADFVYLRLLNNQGKSLHFTVDNLSLQQDETVGRSFDRYVIAEGVTMISNADAEITDADASFDGANKSAIQIYADDTVEVVSAGNGGRDYLFIRFDTRLVKGAEYVIRMTAAWTAPLPANALHYSLDVGAAQEQSVKEYTPIAQNDLFKQRAFIQFTANGNYEYFYLRIIHTNFAGEEHNDGAADNFRFTVDSVSLTAPAAVAISGAPSEEVGLSQGSVTLGAFFSEKEAVAVWSTDDETVATVNSAGVVTLVAAGTVTVTVKSNLDDAVTANVVITVVDDAPKPAEGVEITGRPQADAVLLGEDVALGYKLLPMGATGDYTAVWNSDNTDVATVGADGVVTLVGIGYANVTVTLQGTEISDSFLLRVSALKAEEDKITLYSAHAAEMEAEVDHSWSNQTVITRTTDAEKLPEGASSAYEILSDGTHEWSLMMIRFDYAVTVEKDCEITFDAKWLGDENADGFHYYITYDSLGVDPATWQDVTKDALFKKGAKISFTAAQSAECVYLRILNGNSFNFRFTMTDIGFYMDENSGPQIIAAEGISITSKPKDTVAYKEGATFELQYVFTPEGATAEAVRFSSTDESVATISDSGVITFVGEGETTIRVELVSNTDVYAEFSFSLTSAPIGQLDDGDYIYSDIY